MRKAQLPRHVVVSSFLLENAREKARANNNNKNFVQRVPLDLFSDRFNLKQ